jgi:hypothetical protein
MTEMRYIRPETTLIWMAFLLRGIAWENFASADPDMDRDIGLQPTNYILKFLIFGFLILLNGFI